MRTYLRFLRGTCAVCRREQEAVHGVVHVAPTAPTMFVCIGCAPAVRDMVVALVELGEDDAALSRVLLDQIDFSDEDPTDPDMKAL